MEKSQPQLSSVLPPPGNPPTPLSDYRHSLAAQKFRDALLSVVAAKYATDGSARSLPFLSEQFKSDVEGRLHEYFPSFHTPTHLPYASMIQRAIAEVGEEDGLSEESISEFIVNKYEDLPWAHTAFLGRHLGKLCESGELVKSECGRYNFKVELEGKGVKKKKRGRKSAGRSRHQEVESADEIKEDFDRKKRSKKLVIIAPRVEEIVTSNKQIEEQNDSWKEVIVRAEDGDQAHGGRVLMDELEEEVQEDEMIGEHHGEEIKDKYGPKEFDRQKKSPNLVIVGLCAPVTIKGIEKQSGSLGEEVHEAEEGDHAKGGQIQALGELKEVQADVMIGPHCEKEVKSRDDVQVFDGKKQSQPRKATEEKCGLSREEIDGAKEGGHEQERQVIKIYELKEVRKVGMIDDHHEVEVKSRDVDEDFGGRKQLQDLVVVGLHAKEALTTKGTENKCRSFREKINRAEGDRAQEGQTELPDKFKEVQEVEIIDVHHEEEKQGELMEESTERASKGSNEEEGPSEEATLAFFVAMSNHDNVEENGVIDAQGFKKLQEENEIVEFFDAKSDHGDNGTNDIIGAQSSKGKVLGEVKNKQNRLQEELLSSVSDGQTGISKGCEAQDPRLSMEQPQVRRPIEITGTPSTSMVASPLPDHQTETPKHSEKGMPSTYEALLSSDIICSPKIQPRGPRGRGRPRKLKVQETMANSVSSSAQDCDQQYQESNVEERDTFGPDKGDNTHHIDQQRIKLPRGRGRGRGRPRVVRQDKIPSSEMLSPSKHLHHQQSPEKRCRGRPRKRKFDEDNVSKDVSTSLENEQHEQKGRGRGRPSRGRKKEKELFDNQ